MDKLVIQLFGDILYHKGILCANELEALYDVKTVGDLDIFTQRLEAGELHVLRKGEHYEFYNK